MTIRYTTDGTAPTESSTAYTGAVTIDQTTTLKAAAFRSGWNPSGVATAVYTMKVATADTVTGSLTPLPVGGEGAARSRSRSARYGRSSDTRKTTAIYTAFRRRRFLRFPAGATYVRAMLE